MELDHKFNFGNSHTHTKTHTKSTVKEMIGHVGGTVSHFKLRLKGNRMSKKILDNA